MNNLTADQTIDVALPVYNILEAFLAGTSDSFLVLDHERNITLFNENFNEFIHCATGRHLVKSISFDSYTNDVAALSVLSAAIDKAYTRGETLKFSFSVSCTTKRWYDAEFHPLKEHDAVVGVGIGLFETTHKREAEESVKKSEALFKALVQNSADVFLLTDRFFSVTYVSDAFTHLLGFDAGYLLGRPGFGLIHPDDQEVVAAWLAQLMDHPSMMRPIEFRAKHSSGSWVYMEATGKNLLHDEHVSSLVFTMRGIQAKKLADQALVNAEQRLTLLLNNTKESFIILNSRLRVIAYNKAAQELSPFFFSSELQSGRSLLELIHPSEMQAYISLLEEVLEGREMEKETTFRDGQGDLHIYRHNYRSLDNGTEGQGVFITSTDITEKRRATLALRENEEKFKTIIEYSFDAVLILDAAATIKYVSPSIHRLVGFEAEELIGKNGFDFVYADDIPEVRAKLESIINNEEETYADYRSLTKDGDLKWIEAKGKNMFSNPHIQGILVSLRDISERKRLLEEQTILANELTKYNKDLRQFSFITSHNLRAPVANLMSLLSLYNHNKPADPFNYELIQKFHECTGKLNDTLNDLINVLVIRSKPNVDRELVRFEDVATKIAKNVQALINAANGALEFDFTSAEVVEYNKVHLESIFLNLISNSIKYASPDRPLRISITSAKMPDGISVEFTDNGVGIDLDRYGDRIFGLYQRFHSSNDGKGLGLYMIKSQITASGGTINVTSRPGNGATFTVFFKQ